MGTITTKEERFAAKLLEAAADTIEQQEKRIEELERAIDTARIHSSSQQAWVSLDAAHPIKAQPPEGV